MIKEVIGTLKIWILFSNNFIWTIKSTM